MQDLQSEDHYVRSADHLLCVPRQPRAATDVQGGERNKDGRHAAVSRLGRGRARASIVPVHRGAASEPRIARDSMSGADSPPRARAPVVMRRGQSTWLATMAIAVLRRQPRPVRMTCAAARRTMACVTRLRAHPKRNSSAAINAQAARSPATCMLHSAHALRAVIGAGLLSNGALPYRRASPPQSAALGLTAQSVRPLPPLLPSSRRPGARPAAPRSRPLRVPDRGGCGTHQTRALQPARCAPPAPLRAAGSWRATAPTRVSVPAPGPGTTRTAPPALPRLPAPCPHRAPQACRAAPPARGSHAVPAPSRVV